MLCREAMKGGKPCYITSCETGSQSGGPAGLLSIQQPEEGTAVHCTVVTQLTVGGVTSGVWRSHSRVR